MHPEITVFRSDFSCAKMTGDRNKAIPKISVSLVVAPLGEFSTATGLLKRYLANQCEFAIHREIYTYKNLKCKHRILQVYLYILLTFVPRRNQSSAVSSFDTII